MNELTVINALKTTIINNINACVAEFDTEHLVPTMVDKQVRIEYPEATKINYKQEIYLWPITESIDTKTFRSDTTEETIEIYVLTKQDTDEHLLYQATVIENALIKVLQSNRTLGGEILSLDLEGVDFYPSISPNQTITCLKIRTTLRFIRTW